MRIVTWNVNSVRIRQEMVEAWLLKHEPDVLCLQEIKVVDDDFPVAAFEALGYRSIVYGQKTYNGVAILHKGDATDVRRGFDDGDEEDPQTRILRATFDGVRVVNVYVPNGQALDSDKFVYKMGWFDRLYRVFETQESAAGKLVLLGDFNIAPEDRDVYDPDAWRGGIHFSEPEHAQLARFVDWGLTDTLRMHHQEAGIYSWWDYRQLAFQKRRGLRIDLVLATESLAATCTECVVDKDARRGKGTSDHAPVLADFDV